MPPATVTPASRNTVGTLRRRRVLFINRSYWPDTEATGQLLTELCEDLAQSDCSMSMFYAASRTMFLSKETLTTQRRVTTV